MSLGIHDYDAKNILERKKKRVQNVLSDFRGTLKYVKAGDTGISRRELERLRADGDRLHDYFVKADGVANYLVIEDELDEKTKLLDDLKKERSENINKLVTKVVKMKKQVEKLFELKEKFVKEAKKNLAQNPAHPDIRIVLQYNKLAEDKKVIESIDSQVNTLAATVKGKFFKKIGKKEKK